MLLCRVGAGEPEPAAVLRLALFSDLAAQAASSKWMRQAKSLRGGESRLKTGLKRRAKGPQVLPWHFRLQCNWAAEPEIRVAMILQARRIPILPLKGEITSHASDAQRGSGSRNMSPSTAASCRYAPNDLSRELSNASRATRLPVLLALAAQRHFRDRGNSGTLRMLRVAEGSA